MGVIVGVGASDVDNSPCSSRLQFKCSPRRAVRERNGTRRQPRCLVARFVCLVFRFYSFFVPRPHQPSSQLRVAELAQRLIKDFRIATATALPRPRCWAAFSRCQSFVRALH